MTTTPPPTAGAEARDAGQLRRFGYDQELERGLGFWTNFGLGFAYLSPVVGLFSVIALGTAVAGPGWIWMLPVAMAGQLLAALVFAELAAQFPITGGIYQWSRRLSGTRVGYLTGWFYLWEIILGITSVAYVGVTWTALLFGVTLSPDAQVGWAFVFVAAATLLNSVGQRILKVIINAGIAAEFVGSVLVGATLLLFFRKHPVSLIFHSLGAQATFSGSHLFMYLAVLAVATYPFGGFDACAVVSEETRNPTRRVPRAILASLLATGGIVVLNSIAVGLATPSPQAVMSGKVADPVTPAVTSSFGAWSAKPFEVIVVVAFLACCIAVQTAASRVTFSLARDQLLPGSSVLRRVSPNGEPTAAVVTTGLIGAAFLLFGLNVKALYTILSFPIVGTFLAFLLVCVGALLSRRREPWQPGRPFSLGRWSVPVNVAAVAWLAFSLVNVAWPRRTLALPGAAWWQVWGSLLLLAALSILAIAYILASKPQHRIAGSATFTSPLPASATAPTPETGDSQAPSFPASPERG